MRPESSNNPYIVSDDDVRQKLELSRVGVVSHRQRVQNLSDSEAGTQEYLKIHAPELQSVKKGLRLYYRGLGLLTISYVLSIVLLQGVGPAAPMYILVMGLKVFGLLMVLAGEIRCIAAPKETDAFEYIFASVFFYGISTVIQLFVIIVPQVAFGFAQFPLRAVQVLFEIIAWLLFLTFLAKITRFLGNFELNRQAVNLRGGIGRLVVLFMLLTFSLLTIVRIAPPLAPLVALLGTLGILLYVYLWFRRFAMLIRDTADAITV